MDKKMHLTEKQLQTVGQILSLKPVSYESYELLMKFYKLFKSDISDISLTNIMLWKDKYHFHYCIMDDWLFLANIESDRIYFSVPIGNYENHEGVVQVVRKLKTILNNQDVPLIIKKADSTFKVNIAPFVGAYRAEFSPDESDYIYNFNEMKTLSGNKFHKKKNQVNKFEKNTPSHMFKLVHEVKTEEIQFLLDEWCKEKDCKDNSNLNFEYNGLLEYLNHTAVHETPIGLLYVENELKGMILGEVISDDMLLIHIEKADHNYPGIYQMLGYAYYNALGDMDISSINREQDLGIEGLRKSKMSYHPIRMAEKYNIEFI